MTIEISKYETFPPSYEHQNGFEKTTYLTIQELLELDSNDACTTKSKVDILIRFMKEIVLSNPYVFSEYVEVVAERNGYSVDW